MPVKEENTSQSSTGIIRSIDILGLLTVGLVIHTGSACFCYMNLYTWANEYRIQLKSIIKSLFTKCYMEYCSIIRYNMYIPGNSNHTTIVKYFFLPNIPQMSIHPFLITIVNIDILEFETLQIIKYTFTHGLRNRNPCTQTKILPYESTLSKFP